MMLVLFGQICQEHTVFIIFRELKQIIVINAFYVKTLKRTFYCQAIENREENEIEIGVK